LNIYILGGTFNIIPINTRGIVLTHEEMQQTFAKASVYAARQNVPLSLFPKIRETATVESYNR
jgi:hypothetical protein